MRLYPLICCLLVITACPVFANDDMPNEKEPFVKIKRPALWVPDLDRAIIFYRDVLGMSLFEEGKLEIKEDSVLPDLFNTDTSTRRRALFSSSTDEIALFVMETKDAPEYSDQQKRHAALVIQTDDLAAAEARAKKHGFIVGNSNLDKSITSGREFQETTLIGPGGQAVLLYQLGANTD